jgi:elongation factor P
MVNTNNLKKGIVLKLDGELYEVLDSFHYKPGKGQAFVRAKLRNVFTNSTIDKKLRSGEKVEDVFIDKKNMQFLYADGDNYIFMDLDDYDQIPIPKEVLGANSNYLKDSMEVQIKFYEGRVIGIELPSHVVLEVTYTEPAVRGDTATSATKPITLETGLEVQAPLFINTGDKVKIDTRTGEYVERA